MFTKRSEKSSFFVTNFLRCIQIVENLTENYLIPKNHHRNQFHSNSTFKPYLLSLSQSKNLTKKNQWPSQDYRYEFISLTVEFPVRLATTAELQICNISLITVSSITEISNCLVHFYDHLCNESKSRLLFK